MHIFFSIKFAYEKYISHRNKQSFQKKIDIVTPDKSPLSTISVGILKFFKTIIPKLPKHKEPTLSHHIPHTLSIRQYQNPNHLPSTVHTPTPTRMFVCTYMHVHVQHVHTYIHVHVHTYIMYMYIVTRTFYTHSL